MFDTAANYGDSEEQLGQALKGVPRDSFLIATKWTWKTADSNLPHTDSLIASVERSMRRFSTDVIDIMQIHGIRPENYLEITERFAPTLLQLKEQGKVRLVGFSEMMTDDPKHTVPQTALEQHPDIWDTIMLKYGILNQYAAKYVLPLAQKHGRRNPKHGTRPLHPNQTARIRPTSRSMARRRRDRHRSLKAPRRP